MTLSELKDTLTAVISMCASISIRRGILGGYKPTEFHIGWIYGFCAAASDHFDLNEEQSSTMTAVIFMDIFGNRAGQKNLSKIAEANGAGYKDALELGALSFMQYWEEEIPPTMSNQVFESPLIWNARLQKLLTIDGVGEKTAEKIIFKAQKNMDMTEKEKELWSAVKYY